MTVERKSCMQEAHGRSGTGQENSVSISFDLVHSKTVAEEGCAEMPDDLVAMDAAELLAKRLLRERPESKNRGFAILVPNDEAEEVCRVPLDIVAPNSPRREGDGAA
jgi:hypothetical protein